MANSNFVSVSIKSKDTVPAICKKHGINDWRGVWALKENEKIRKLRKGPENIQSGDKLMIPVSVRKDALTEGEMFSYNYNLIVKWIESNSKKIKAKPGASIFYAGNDLECLELVDAKVDGQDMKILKASGMYKFMERSRARFAKKYKVSMDFQSINDVLRRIGEYPDIVDRDRVSVNYPGVRNAFDFFLRINEMKKFIPDAEKNKSRFWSKLSDAYAANAEGDIAILDGVSNDYGSIGRDKDLIDVEIKALLKNKNLSTEGKKILENRFHKYASHFTREHASSMNIISAELKDLRKKVSDSKKIP